MIYESFSAEETEKIASELAKNSQASDVFCLNGDLGVGKTVFSKGFGKGLGITEPITSPTFTIINIYIGRLPLYHFDVYRISDVYEMDDTGYEDYFYGDGVCLVEWAEQIEEIIPNNAKWIYIEKDLSKGEAYRRIKINTSK